MIKYCLLAFICLAISCKTKEVDKKIDTKNYYSMDSTGIFPRAEWIHNTNVYEVNLRQYTTEGTFNAFAKEIPRLKEMGVETLWFMPITPIAEKNKKGTLGSPYAAAEYSSISPEFGTLEDFKNLVKTAHDAGMKVIIDWVANHTGWDHIWTKEHPGYYLKDTSTNDFKIASGMDDIIELDYSNPALRKAMISAMQYWVRQAGIDGFRCDLATWVEKDFWVEARTALQEDKVLFWLGEFDPIENPEYMQVFDAAYSWKWMHATEDFYKKSLPLETLDTLLHQYDTAGGKNAMKLWFTSNHDENSWNGTEYEKYGKAAKAFAVFSFTWNGIPLIYSGQELPNQKRLEFFEKDVINWNGTYAMAPFYKTLTALRSRNPALRAADDKVQTYYLQANGGNGKILAYLRKNGDKAVLVLLNLSDEFQKVGFTETAIVGKYKKVFGPQEDVEIGEGHKFSVQPWEYLVFEK